MDDSESLEVKIVQGENAIDLIKEDWNKLLLRISTPSLEQDWRWNKVLVAQIFKSRFTLLSVQSGSTLVAIFPMQSSQLHRLGLSFNCLSHLSDSKYLDLSDALIHPEWQGKPLLQAIKKYLKKSTYDLIEFSDFTSRSSVSKLITTDWLLEHASYKNAYVECATPDDLKKLSKKHIKNVERLASKAEAELGCLGLEILIGKDISTTDVDDLLDIEHSGWKANSGTSIKASNSRGFYESVIGELSPTNDAYLIFLKTPTKRIACALAFKAGTTLYLHKIAYRDETKDFGPGNIMLLNLIRKMAEHQDINEVNLVTCPDWSERWHLQVANKLSLRCFNSTLKGQIFYFLLRFKKWINNKKQNSEKNTLETVHD
jgi:Acetyltransferase (GNAT) domain